MKLINKAVCFAALFLVMASLAGAEDNVILDSLGFWRSYFSFSTLVTDDGGKLQKVGIETNSALPPSDWTTAEFDDTGWNRMADVPFATYKHWMNNYGGVDDQGDSIAISVICIRGKFNVVEPVRAGKMNLSLVYRGGVVVYVNGKEVARGHMPKEGKLLADTPAEVYGKEVYLNEKGVPFAEDKKNIEFLLPRLRTLENISIPKEVLIKGTNVLALEIHRSPLPKEVYDKVKDVRFGAGGKLFDGCGLVTARLTAAGSGVLSNAVRPSKTQIWNSQPLAPDYDTDWGDPNEQLRPLVLAGAKNGYFSGKVVVGSTAPLKRIKAVITDLAGKNGEKIPASAIQVRYAVTDLILDNQENFLPLRMDKLQEVPPKEIPVRAIKPSQFVRKIPGAPDPVYGAVLPVWVTVNVSAEAKPADYEGELSITVDSGNFKVPVKLRVYNYRLPDPKDYTGFYELIQSPETLALVYNVPLWSEKHWKYIEKSLSYIGAIGTKTCYIPLICKTNMGNEETMVRWIKDKDKYKYDFTVMEKYLDLVEKYQGKPSVVCFYVWDHFLEADGVYFKGKNVSKEVDADLASNVGKGPEVTLLKNGKAEEFALPMYTEAGAKPLWKPLVEELKNILKKRKLEKTMMLGIVSDREPTKDVLKFWKELLPDTLWLKHSHQRPGNVSIPYGLTGTVWDRRSLLTAVNKTGKAGSGWKSKDPFTFFGRDIRNTHPAATFRMTAEINTHGEQRGFSRLGADFWSIKGGAAVNRFGSQHGMGVLVSDGRFPKGSWLNLNIRTSLLGSGPDGAISTARYEMMREGIQECEARIAMEKLIDGNKLNASQAKRCEKILADRNEAIYWGFYDNRDDYSGKKAYYFDYTWTTPIFAKYGPNYYLGSGWQERSADLYDIAAEATGTDKKAGFATSFRDLVKQEKQEKQGKQVQ
ncbi:MAG: hypothetical protein A2231_08635 [Candidatus Firestonebacteria bacterium RIFOXYA2_FULL_40_8]|nr:MAG: hypothetical protein A2231_08635 [Candidatus Firestonebacteria bacterium RIFOXYA2_FULL_40_8]